MSQVDTTILNVKNPLRYKRQFETAENSALATHKERQAWLDAKMRQLIPAEIYTKVHSKDKIAQDEGLKWLITNKWQVVNQDMTTEIHHEGVVLARFIVQLTEQ